MPELTWCEQLARADRIARGKVGKRPHGAPLCRARRGPSSGAGYHFTSGNSAIERLQEARHSGLLICVAASQKPMQASSDLPPPPGLLGVDSLGLLEDVPGDSARFGAEPPPVAN